MSVGFPLHIGLQLIGDMRFFTEDLSRLYCGRFMTRLGVASFNN